MKIEVVDTAESESEPELWWCCLVVLQGEEALERDAGEKERGRARLLRDPFLP